MAEQTEHFDVFVSYGHEDTAWVHTLAENLHRAGLDVFLDEWEIAPGDVVVHGLEAGLLHSRNGILVVSPASVTRPWVRQEYAAMVNRALEGTQRLIPVLLGDVELPPFAATRRWVDFRGVDGPEYQDCVGELVAALRGEQPELAERDGRLVPPPGTGMRPEGARRVTLRIGLEETALTPEDAAPVTGGPAGLDHQLKELLWQVDRARRLGLQATAVALRGADHTAADTAGAALQGRLMALGKGLTAAFLPDPVREALVREVELATRANASLRLRLELADPALEDLPWETLVLTEIAAGPLVLHPRVELYRALSGLGMTPAIQIPGPLRILVVIGSPDEGERGELLDYESELKRILDAVRPARRQGRAYVRILNRGTVAETRAALKGQRFHVLHVSCHARPGTLVLEDERGRPDLVTAERFATEILVADRGVPLVMLSGCSTALTERIGIEQAADTQPDGEAEASPEPQDGAVRQGEAALPGLARELLGHGVPAVLAMNAPVTDPYAARLGAWLYQELATQELPDPLAALSEARRQVDAELRGAPTGSREAGLGELAEWATPVLVLRGPSRPLLNPAQAFESVQAPPEPRLAPGIVVRGVGDFVGRRREERLFLAALRGQRAGVVIHGIGGVGKSTLAAQLIHDLGEQAGLVVSLARKVTVDQVLDEAGRRLLSAALAQGWEETHPLRRLAVILREPKVEWADRLDVLGEHLLQQRPVVLLLDNFEDNLQPAQDGRRGFELADPQLAEFLAAWISTRGMSRLLITSRHPFPLPDYTDRRLEPHHLGPLSLAETRKLVWRLPGLDQLEPDQLQRAYADVGGHPRALEYLDALLRGGQARFDDVTDRLEQALAAHQIDNPRGWLAEVGEDLDRALAETVTLAVNDVLLGQLLDGLDGVPLARRLLLGVSVYRVPVDEHGITWQIAEELRRPADPQRQERLRQLAEALRAAQDAGREVTIDQLGLTEAEFADLLRELTQEPRPPLVAPTDLPDALAILAEFGLVAPAHPADPMIGSASPLWVVHRWTATALARMAAEPELQEAHRRAARYWRWRVQAWPQDRQADIADMLEARYHHQAAGDIEDLIQVTQWTCSHLMVWGAWSWEEQLCRETLQIVSKRSKAAAIFTHQLGIIAQSRGDYDEALSWYRQALAISEEVGDRAGMARTYHQLGNLAFLRGDYDEALNWYRQALAISEELGDRANMANSYHQLGMIAFERGDYDQAQNWYRQALAILEELGHRRQVAYSYGELGNIALRRGDYDQALEWYRQTLTISEELGDRASMGGSYFQLGRVAQERGDYDQALQWCRQALTLFEALGDRKNMAIAYHQLGIIAQSRGGHDQALNWYRQALAVSEEVGDRAGMANSYDMVGTLAQEQGDHDQALNWYRQALAINEELGNRAGMAITMSHIGALFTETGNPSEGLIWNLRSLRIRAELGLPQAAVDRRWLQRQRALLGPRAFEQLVRQELDNQDSQMVKELLQQIADAD